MPELPELHGMAVLINEHAAGRIYFGCKKSSKTKLPTVKPPRGYFTLSALSRGKELIITLHPAVAGKKTDDALSDVKSMDTPQPVFVLCNMGLTGCFEAVPTAKQRHKHAHLSFHATDGSILSYVDVMRFGTWRSMKAHEWPVDRGPDPVKEYHAFRRGVVGAVAENPKRFANVPICQVVHNQKLFNGIGNYLRAEILFRAGIPPFAEAKHVLRGLPDVPGSSKDPDLLALCRDVPKEVMKLKVTKYSGGKPTGSMAPTGDDEQVAWAKWLRVYSCDDASWAVDKEKRRIWFRGAPGKLYKKFALKAQLVKRKGSESTTGTKRTTRRVKKSSTCKRPAAARKR